MRQDGGATGSTPTEVLGPMAQARRPARGQVRQRTQSQAAKVTALALIDALENPSRLAISPAPCARVNGEGHELRALGADDGWQPTSRTLHRARRVAMLRAVALAKRKLIRWLLAHDFEELPRRATSHRRFRGPGTTITVPAHGRLELSAKHTGMLIRELEKAGFDRDQIREELGL